MPTNPEYVYLNSKKVRDLKADPEYVNNKLLEIDSSGEVIGRLIKIIWDFRKINAEVAIPLFDDFIFELKAGIMKDYSSDIALTLIRFVDEYVKLLSSGFNSDEIDRTDDQPPQA